MPSAFVLSVAGLAATYVFLRALAFVVEDPREPKTITGAIPFISPLVGMLTEKTGFYIRMRDQYNLPIYTLRVPGPPLYIANSLSICQRIDRHILTVAFSPIQMRACEKAMGVSKAGMDSIANHRRLAEDGYFRSFPRSSAAAISPGPGLDALNKAAIGVFATSLDRLADKGRTSLDLYKWIRHELFAATNEATYGLHNPFRHFENEKAWFEYESSIMVLLMDFFPRIIARKSLQARDRMVRELHRYLERGQHEQGSLLVQIRRKHNAQFGLDTRDSAHIEVGQVAAGIVNTAPTAFWFIWKILSDPEVLQDCRHEVQELVEVGPDESRTINLAQVRTSCPILVSTWQETLRFYGISISARIIQEDTMVDNDFLLKKGGVLLMPNATIHSDKAIWGPTADEFNHKRFLKTNTGGDAARHPAAAFRGFGSGHVLCPGRHFASMEVLALAALILVRFDVSPRSGKWSTPKKDMAMDRACPLPLSNTEVDFVPRDNHKWSVTFTGSSQGINIVAEDLERET
ncbi:cytochrome P450 [Stachybotrys elegans]|uniref:Cytochrome P450 n=1 Tax=Stachybotrys elegans TaxID=80388 RepID=A0A8K0WQM1_9HYPO|nr:cytochrome P450 [Stachybotrys elegans]